VTVVVDASIAAAWLLPEKDSDAAEALIAGLSGRPPIPSLFWHEARNVLIMAERRGRIVAGEAAAAMGRLRRLPLEDAGAGSDGAVVALATAHRITAYDAAYLALAQERGLPLATLDQKLAQAARRKASRCSGRSAVRPTDGEGEWATLSFLA
jgi:predicted nucleic acid-binding protein